MGTFIIALVICLGTACATPTDGEVEDMESALRERLGRKLVSTAEYWQMVPETDMKEFKETDYLRLSNREKMRVLKKLHKQYDKVEEADCFQ